VVVTQKLKVRSSIGFKSPSGSNGGFHRSYTASAIKSGKAITDALLSIFDQLEDASTEIMLESLEPTLELADYYCPKDTGDLVNSHYLKEAGKGSEKRIEIGYALGGNPRYAGFVHEATWIPRRTPERSKFLQAAVMEDLNNIYNRIGSGYRNFLNDTGV
jgi:hypothetical protein